MRIAFDLDGTLIPGQVFFELEPVPAGLFARWVSREPLRKGTVRLFRALRNLGHDVWICTTSFRKPLTTRLLFWGYGAPVAGVINQDMHAKRMAELGEAYKTCTKYPPAFGVDVLVDDSEAVLIEARRYRFSVVLVKPNDPDWTGMVAAYLGVRLP